MPLASRITAPTWWYRQGSWPARLLSPLGRAYGQLVSHHYDAQKATGYRSRLPVICVGNFTVGGAGKTPTAQYVVQCLREGIETERPWQPALLLRGYGGTETGPHKVSPEKDTALRVGDEAVMLARQLPTCQVWIAADRAAGARAIERTEADVIVMDDGFLNPALKKDVSLIVLDGSRGVGNGKVLPAGPLRAPLDWQMRLADALLIIGKDQPALSAHFVAQGKPVFHGRLVPAFDPDSLRGRPLIAFAGIGRPGKFFSLLMELGIQPLESVSFPDHYRFTPKDAARLLAKAERTGARLVTTEKDHVRLGGEAPEISALRQATTPLPIRLAVTESPDFASFLLDRLKGRKEN